ncbi:Cytidylate kinase [Lentzea xinjiangensis]|uniref:Cytidylate kinase n=1 Tax=Lentzea xinjiangensis TaxID=402600 RepID=A0A1H9FA48_9PSEU|nr:(d)CMP kinase [Lentzea xinjiangensis]SEQ34313.1 Cytidylate kinase [Lentzea xinjiangensis]
MTASPPRLGATRLVAVDGPAGAGKSTFARRLAGELGAALVLTDHFATWDDPTTRWWPGLLAVFDDLAAGRAARYRKTDWSRGFPRPGEGDEVVLVPGGTIIFEGMSSARKAIAHRLSFAIFVDHGDEQARLERAVRRDGEEHREHFRRWQQYERGWFAVDETRTRADYVVTSS